MKRITTVLMLAMLVVFASCEQPTMLSVSQTALSFENSGGNQSVTITANKVWTASSNQGWLRVSPSSGEGTATLSISCEGNTTYDSRTGNITIVSEELTQTISVTQAEGLGLLISQPEYNLSNEAQSISVTVQANVQYTVDIDNACRDWIKQESTKGLSSNNVKFAISKNESYDGREGKITIRQTNGSLSATVVVKQSQTNGLFADKTEYEVSYEEQQLNIKVKSNVDYEVQIDDSCKDWISRVQTKGLVESTVSLAIGMNEDVEREGVIVIKYGSIQETVRIKQKEGCVEFDDDNFKSYCITNFDINKDGKLSYYEASKISSIYVNTENIISVKGIEHMPNLESLYCVATWGTNGDRNGKLKVLDVSHNSKLTLLACEGNQITSLDVSGFVGLKELWCRYNKLTSLNISGCTALTHLDCRHNQITDCLDVGGFNAVTELYCEANKLTSINIDGCTALQELECGGNLLTDLDVSSCKGLQAIECQGNQLKRLDVSDFTDLVYLYCSNNPLTYLNVDNCSALKTLTCSELSLTNLDVSDCKALQIFYCNKNQLTSLDVNKNTELIWLYCCNNMLTSLDVSNNIKLSKLDCRNNPSLTKIWLKTGQEIDYFQYDTNTATVYYVDGVVPFEDANFKAYCVQKFDTDGDGEISYNEAQSISIISVKTNDIKSLKGIEYFKNLSVLDCHGTIGYEWDSSLNGNVAVGHGLLTALDLRKNTALTKIHCSANHLTSIDVSENKALTELYCSTNQLTSLDVSHNKALLALECSTNQLTNLDVSHNTALTWLGCSSNQLTSLDVSHNMALTSLNCGENQLTILDVSHNTALTSLACHSNQLTILDVSHNTALTWLGCTSNQLTSLDVSHNTALEYLLCQTNQLTSLDVSNNATLTGLSCFTNRLTSLDVSHNKALLTLECSTNQLTNLDVSHNTALLALECSTNQLTNLDVSHNTALTRLACSSNQLTSLDVSHNTALIDLYCSENQLTNLDVSHNTALTRLTCSSNQLTSLDVSHNTALLYLVCNDNPYLIEIWLKTGQVIPEFIYNTDISTIKYK